MTGLICTVLLAAIFLPAGTAHAVSYAPGDAWDSPGVASGNNVKAPVHVPVNALWTDHQRC